jgi:hypothetical protein
MIETVQWRRRITKHHARLSARSEPQGGDITVILMLSLFGLALSLFAIRRGWLGEAEYLTNLFALL